MVVYDELRHLTQDTREAAEVFLTILKEKKLSPYVLETYRTQERQDYLFKNFGPHSKVKKTDTPYSWHTAGRAMDVGISPPTIDNIVFFLETAQALGFTTVANPQKIREQIRNGETPSTWDWHHISFHGGRERIAAIKEYEELLARGPNPPPSFLSTVSNLLLIGSVIGLFFHASKD